MVERLNRTIQDGVALHGLLDFSGDVDVHDAGFAPVKNVNFKRCFFIFASDKVVRIALKERWISMRNRDGAAPSHFKVLNLVCQIKVLHGLA